MLKVACWPVYLLGTVLAVARAEIPYVPTAKDARRGRFLALAAPHLVLLALYLTTLGATAYRRLILAPRGSLFLTAEAVWGMVAFASASMLLSAGGIHAAWQARRPPTGAAWDGVPDGMRAAPSGPHAAAGAARAEGDP
jgi:cellulose synthase (UDP-forming)